MYRNLDPARIIETTHRLHERIVERFPDASLARVAAELHQVAQDNARRSEEIIRPNRLLRLSCWFLIVLAAAAVVAVVSSVHPHLETDWRWLDVIQTFEALLGSLFFLGAGVLFLVTLETRVKRQRCLNAIHEMRAMAHIVDMHQLTKDPESLMREGPNTPSSPDRTMSRFELTRYLDYSSEMLSLMGKIAAIYVQKFPDPQAVGAVDEVENLTTALSRKIWQKIMILERQKGGTES